MDRALTRRVEGSGDLGDETLSAILKMGFLWVLCGLLVSFNASANPEPHVRVNLVSAVTSVAPGDSFRVIFRQEIDEGWHTYWTNPGDSGAPPDIEWLTSTGVSVSALVYPYPERIPYGPLMNFGYHDEVLILFSVSVPKTFSNDVIDLAGVGSVLVCADICIPEKVEMSLSVAVGETILDSDAEHLFSLAEEKIPAFITVDSSLRTDGDNLLLFLGFPGVANNRLETVEYFPSSSGLIDNASMQSFSMSEEGLTLTLARGFDFKSKSADMSGVIVIQESVGDGLVSSFEVSVRDHIKSPRNLNRNGEVALSEWHLLGALGFAFLGGLILNLMPCVFPVLSIKILSLVNFRNSNSSMRLHGLAYATGVVVSFIAIALTLMGLRAGGEAIGWGFQLQSPIVVSILAYLFMAIALNLLGVFQVGGRLMSLGESGKSGESYLSSVSTGVLATVVAAPCTAPFMGAAVGYAVVQSSVVAVLVFISLGLGMALPYLVLCFAPNLLARLPKPGSWMDTMKQLLAFPMLATSVWLLWVLGVQAGADAIVKVLAGALLITLALWLLNQSDRLTLRIGASLLFLIALYITLTQETKVEQSPKSLGNSESLIFSEGALAEAKKEGPVFVNFTAAWCITCKVNEINALDTDRIKRAFREKGVTYIKGDWTNEDPNISAALEKYGRSGVPLYLLYAEDAQRAKVLPQILTQGVVLDALATLDIKSND